MVYQLGRKDGCIEDRVSRTVPFRKLASRNYFQRLQCLNIHQLSRSPRSSKHGKIESSSWNEHTLLDDDKDSGRSRNFDPWVQFHLEASSGMPRSLFCEGGKGRSGRNEQLDTATTRADRNGRLAVIVIKL